MEYGRVVWNPTGQYRVDTHSLANRVAGAGRSRSCRPILLSCSQHHRSHTVHESPSSGALSGHSMAGLRDWRCFGDFRCLSQPFGSCTGDRPASWLRTVGVLSASSAICWHDGLISRLGAQRGEKAERRAWYERMSLVLALFFTFQSMSELARSVQTGTGDIERARVVYHVYK